MNRGRRLCISATIILLILFTGTARAISTTGIARAVVIAAITITNTSTLAFGTGSRLNPAKTVDPGTSENSSNGSFTVVGQANTSYSITLPAGTITMTTGSGTPASRQIAVTSFQSFPAAGANGLLDATGEQLLFVGATRAALRADQVAGNYTAAYTVTVIY